MRDPRAEGKEHFQEFLNVLNQKIQSWFGRGHTWTALQKLVSCIEAQRTDQSGQRYKCSLTGPVLEDVISMILPEPEPLID